MFGVLRRLGFMITPALNPPDPLKDPKNGTP